MGFATLLIVGLIVVLVVVPVWVIMKVTGLAKDNEAQHLRLLALEDEIARLRREVAGRPKPAMAAPEILRSVPTAETATMPTERVIPVPAPAAPIVPTEPSLASVPDEPPLISLSPEPQVGTSIVANEPARRAKIDWEQFMGAKLFAWIGGLAAFLAVGFFVKYSFEHELIPPEVRVALGFLLSAGMIVGGWLMPRDRYRITAQVLCASGVVSLYAVTFACNAVYRFEFFDLGATFLLMALITAAAFLLAVRMEAPVVALLGLLGGFLTPILLSTGQDQPRELFSYVALLDVGLITVALHRRWHYLVSLAAAGTVLMQVGWAEKFLAVEKVPIAMTVSLGLAALFLLAAEAGRALRRPSAHSEGSAAALAFVALGFAVTFLQYPSIAAQPWRLFAFAFVADLFVLALAARGQRTEQLHLFSGAALFALLGVWTGFRLTSELLSWALAAYLVFAVLHTAFPLWLSRRGPAARATWWSQLFPPLTLLLLLLPVFKLSSLSLLYWPTVLAIGVLAVMLALVSGSLLALGLVLVLTVTTAAAAILRLDAAVAEPLGLLGVIAGFAVFFCVTGLFVARRIDARRREDGPGEAASPAPWGGPAAQIPATAALLPFALLVMMSQRLTLANPSALFGVALLLVVLVFGLTRLLSIAWLPGLALLGLAGLEYTWHFQRFSAEAASTPLLWYAGFHALFAVFPFVFRRSFGSLTGPWAVGALSGIVQFPLVYRLVQRAWPNEIPGLLPVLFAVPPLLALVAVLRSAPGEPKARLNRLAWYGGAALFFVTLVFPIQLEREWITVGWALEGVALLWLFGRVPHPGLRATGVGLLAIVFVRLALNPTVLAYHPRGEWPLFNWYLYTYGTALTCMFVGAALLRRQSGANSEPGTTKVLGIAPVPLLSAFGTILAFLLLNIEIADYFSSAGRTLTFEFRGNFARDMAYTIGWALFALGLLAAGIWKGTRAARYAALGLLSVTLLKLFLHDLAHLGQLYRVGALIAVAAVAILASFLYQRFVPGTDRAPGQER